MILLEPCFADDDPGWIDLETPVDFPSAIDAPKAADPEKKGLQLRARWGVRPYAGVTGVESGGWGGIAGAQVSHQWWSLRERAIKPVGETRLRLAAPFGGVLGWRATLDSTAGV